MNVKTWARNLVESARQTGSTTQIARAAVRGRTDVAVVVASFSAARDFQARYLMPAAQEANLAFEVLSRSAVRLVGEDGSAHTVYVLTAGQETRGFPAVPILFDPDVMYLIASFAQVIPALGAARRNPITPSKMGVPLSPPQGAGPLPISPL